MKRNLKAINAIEFKKRLKNEIHNSHSSEENRVNNMETLAQSLIGKIVKVVDELAPIKILNKKYKLKNKKVY